jgi:NAD(P)H-dependent flavin oxidoreductase YrpB (nitropropane dioxygenase family)
LLANLTSKADSFIPDRLRTPLTTILGIRVPVIQAPIGSFSCPALAAAVSEAGGLGTLALSWDSPAVCREKIAATQAATHAPFGINLVLEWDQSDRLNACLEAGVKVVSFFWGVCQGFEAGGHVRGVAGSIALVPAVVDRVAPLPIVAAGGFADGRGLAAALALGASGVWMGTRFSAATESLAHAEFKQRLVNSGESDTQYLCLFEGGWPNAPHRVLRNSTVDAWNQAGQPGAGQRPHEKQLIGRSPKGGEILRYDDMPPVLGMTGDWEACALYAGQSVGVIHEIKSAGSIVNEIVSDARRTILSLARAMDISGG